MMTALRTAQLEKSTLSHSFFCSRIGTQLTRKRPRRVYSGEVLWFTISPFLLEINYTIVLLLLLLLLFVFFHLVPRSLNPKRLCKR